MAGSPSRLRGKQPCQSEPSRCYWSLPMQWAGGILGPAGHQPRVRGPHVRPEGRHRARVRGEASQDQVKACGGTSGRGAACTSSVQGRISWVAWRSVGKLRVPLELRVDQGDPLVSPQGSQISFGVARGSSGFKYQPEARVHGGSCLEAWAAARLNQLCLWTPRPVSVAENHGQLSFPRSVLGDLGSAWFNILCASPGK